MTKITVRQASEISGLTIQTIYQRIHRGTVTAEKMPDGWVVEVNELIRHDPTEIQDRELTSQEAATALGVCSASITRLCKSGKIVCRRDGAHWIVDGGSLREWAKTHTRRQRTGKTPRWRGVSIDEETFRLVNSLAFPGESKGNALKRILSKVATAT